MTPYECAQQIIHACAGNPDRTSEAANTIQRLVSEAATELLSFHRRRSDQLERERDEWCATAANAKANEDAAILDLSALRQELRETAAALVAMREILIDLVNVSAKSCTEEAWWRANDAIDIRRISMLGNPSSLAAKIEAVVKAARALDKDSALQAVAGWYDSLVDLRNKLAALSSGGKGGGE